MEIMTHIEKAAENYRQPFRGPSNHISSMDIKKSFEDGADYMLERVLDFMSTFQNGNGEFSLYDYIGNVHKAMEE